MKKFFNAMAGFFKGDPNKVDENGFTRLQRAVADGDLARVVGLIKAGADVNFRGAMMFPPLHMALDKDRHGIAVALIQANADINLKDAQGKTPLHHAAAQSQDGFVQMLLKLGAEPNIADEENQTPLHVLGTARPALIDLLVSYGADPNVRDIDGKTPLHLFLNKPQMVERLLRNKADPNIADVDGKSPFQYMLDEKRFEKFPDIAYAMLRASARIDAVNDKGENLLLLAARMEKTDAFSAVIDKADLNQKDHAGNNVLHILARTQAVFMLSRVLDRAPELLAEKNHAGLTPLGELCDCAYNRHWAMQSNSLESAARIMLIRGAAPDATDRAGHTLLHFAAATGRVELAEYLLSRKANPDIKDDKGMAPLHLAIEKKNMDMLDLLLDRGANPDLTDARGWTVLDRLAEKGDRDSSVVQRLIVAGGQYNKQLPLNPELMRGRAKDNRALESEKTDDVQQGGALDKPRKTLRLPAARDFAKPAQPPQKDAPPVKPDLKPDLKPDSAANDSSAPKPPKQGGGHRP
ncbi:MAG: ankyrin repeat domain-containing protein [Bdellovibrionales bacterium]|nr:ankyrin repeat domain-containing protein [Bdellovibrionales bacterium]